jgi:hypothetical protein
MTITTNLIDFLRLAHYSLVLVNAPHQAPVICLRQLLLHFVLARAYRCIVCSDAPSQGIYIHALLSAPLF